MLRLSAPFRLLPVALAGAVALLAAGPVFGQSACERYRAELDALGPGGPDPRARQYQDAAQRQQSEIERTRAYYGQIGCGRSGGGGNVFFNEPPSPECGALADRMRRMEANLTQLRQQAAALSSGNVEYRRRQLIAAIQQTCRNEASRQPNLFERLFGVQPSQNGQPVQVPVEQQPAEQPGVSSGSKIVCVRTCDGYFFPLASRGREGAAAMCQALCPAARTEVFSMRPGSTIETAVSASGAPYTSLPNASVYEKQVVQSCTCKPPNENWAQALQGAQSILEPHPGDLIVTAQKAEELSHPQTAADTKRSKPANDKGKGKKAKVSDSADTDAEQAIDQKDVPTASQESSGIGPDTIRSEKIVSEREGQYREITGPDGKTKKVRVVAPNIFVPPDQKPKAR